MRILISGAGIAGPTLAYWLAGYGFKPTLIERAPRLRTGGYIIDFWGAGFEIAERMGMLPELRPKGYDVKEVRIVGRNGKKTAGFPADVFAKATMGHYLSIPRGDLAELIFDKLGNQVETIFGDSIACIEQSDRAVQVEFENAGAREFDLVVGADGLHSRVRELVFGPEDRFEQYLGYKAAAFEVRGYCPRDELVYVMYTEVGQQTGRFAMRDDRTMFLFIFADKNADSGELRDPAAQKALLRARFGNSGWECPQILDALDSCTELYFDRVSQIRMPANDGLWTRGRVTLLGDAAFCVSLLAGQGSALAMVAAYILAGELHRSNGDFSSAFARYQKLLGPFIARKQKAAVGFAGAFAPKSKPGLFLRNQIFNAMSIPWIANLAVGHDFADRIVLPEYS